ncbi:MAG: cation diffusion facilitator family transporter [Clostridium sp.]|nr:cation diffusion facilitator family transporter [Clostridium sp.]
MLKALLTKAFDKKDLNNTESRKKLGIASGIAGILGNLLLCLIKFIAGTISNSVSITADAVNNLSDAGASIVTIVGTKLSSKPIDKEHPFGHGRIEYISALIVSFFIFVMGFELGKSSVVKILSPAEVSYNIWTILILAAGILIKLFMAYYNHILFKLTNNINLKAVMQDSLNDCIATAAAMAALLIASHTPFKRADGIIGLLVAGIIFISGIKIVRDITGKLLGQAPDETLVKSIIDIMCKEEYIIGVHDLIVHDYGVNRIIASAHAEVPSTADIVEIHRVIDRVEKEIVKSLGVSICIHMDPVVTNDKETDKYKHFIKEILYCINREYSFHDFQMIKSHGTVNLIFDLVVPFEKNESSADILNRLKQEIRAYDESIHLIVTVEHAMT